MRGRGVPAAGGKRRSASIRKAVTVGKHDELRLRVDDELVRLNVGDRLWRRVIRNYLRFLSHFRIGWRSRGDGIVFKTQTGVTPRSDLLIVLLRRQSRVLLHCCSGVLVHRDWLGLFTISAVIYRLESLLSRLKRGCDNRRGSRHRFLHFRCGARPGEWEMQVRQPKHDPYENAELDRNKIRNFQVHFGESLRAIIKKTETKENHSFNLAKILSGSIQYNNLKIWGSPAAPGRLEEASLFEPNW
ncbi:MAG: hypothetical protein QOC70_305 [Verrucomicrobiota bacterium]|jgi:hypothetical protein